MEMLFNLYPNTFNKVFYNLEGKKFKSIKLTFDFENEKLAINGKFYKVEKNSKYIYKIMKTKIKAINGIRGLYEFIKEANSPGAYNNNRIYLALIKAAA
jgi:hypothetical protein